MILGKVMLSCRHQGAGVGAEGIAGGLTDEVDLFGVEAHGVSPSATLGVRSAPDCGCFPMTGIVGSAGVAVEEMLEAEEAAPQALDAVGFGGPLLYVGSGDVYGRVEEGDLPVRETQPLRPRNPYAVSKVAAEALCYQWSQTGGFRVVMARPFNHIGPGQDVRFAVADFARQIMEMRLGRREPVLVTGDLDVTRDFSDVRDVVRAYHLLLEQGENGAIYNVCSGRERPLRSLVEGLLQSAGVQADLCTDRARLRPVEQRRMVGDATTIRAAVGWTNEIPLEQTLTDILDYWEKELI